jgi:hypothetical protein
MALEDLVKGGNVTAGLIIGAAILIAPALIGPLLRPLAKTAVKAVF